MNFLCCGRKKNVQTEPQDSLYGRLTGNQYKTPLSYHLCPRFLPMEGNLLPGADQESLNGMLSVKSRNHKADENKSDRRSWNVNMCGNFAKTNHQLLNQLPVFC